jgi:DNA-binding response OmpR family regulator
MATRTTVLLVDDEELLRRLLSRMLVDAGFAVIEAENGRAALATAERLDGSLSLVVTDIQMPVMGGLEFAREFRPLRPRTPILFITGRDPDSTAAAASDIGEGQLLRKPFGADAFLEAIARTLSQIPGPGRTRA